MGVGEATPMFEHRPALAVRKPSLHRLLLSNPNPCIRNLCECRSQHEIIRVASINTLLHSRWTLVVQVSKTNRHRSVSRTRAWSLILGTKKDTPHRREARAQSKHGRRTLPTAWSSSRLSQARTLSRRPQWRRILTSRVFHRMGIHRAWRLLSVPLQTPRSMLNS